MQAVRGRQKGGSWSQTFLAKTAETGDENAMRTCYHTLAHREQYILLNAVFCEDRLAKIPVLYAHLTHKMMSSVFGMSRSTNSIA